MTALICLLAALLYGALFALATGVLGYMVRPTTPGLPSRSMGGRGLRPRPKPLDGPRAQVMPGFPFRDYCDACHILGRACFQHRKDT